MTTLLAALFLAPHPLMRDFIGLNTHTVQFKPDLYQPVTRLLRNYHPMAWDYGDDPTMPLSFPTTKNGVNWLELYGAWKKAGYRTEASLQFESMKPDRWKEIPKTAFAYGQTLAKTLGPSGEHPLLEAVEIGNEPADFTEAQYRQMFENMAKGIRIGDPKLKIAPCAVAVGKEDKYSKDIASLEGLERYIDVLNVHTYPFAEYWPTWRRSYPEDPKLRYLKQAQEIIDWRDRHAPGRPVWITEFGYDASTKKPAPTGDFAKWEGNTDDEQARYIVRSYLLFSGMDLERAYLYWFNDDDTPQLHGSSGLTRNYKPKPSFYAVAHLLKTLGDYRYEKAIRKDDIYVYEYRKGTNRIWAVWSPTGSGRHVDVALPATGGKIVRAERMPLKEGAAETVPLVTKGGATTLAVDEVPVYLWISGR